MRRYEYKVVPAPRRGEKAKGVKTTEERFALAMANLMNKLGADGWDYLRSDTLQVEDKPGWMRRPTVSEQSMLVFRREIEAPPSYAAPAYASPAQPVANSAIYSAEAPVLSRAAAPRDVFVESVPLASERSEPRFAARREEPAEARAPRLGPARGE